jgi:hypothetical protein
MIKKLTSTARPECASIASVYRRTSDNGLIIFYQMSSKAKQALKGIFIYPLILRYILLRRGLRRTLSTSGRT